MNLSVKLAITAALLSIGTLALTLTSSKSTRIRDPAAAARQTRPISHSNKELVSQAEPQLERIETPASAAGPSSPSPDSTPAAQSEHHLALQARLSLIRKSFATNSPDIQGLLEIAGTMANAMSLVPDSLDILGKPSEGILGKLEIGSEVSGTFSAGLKRHTISIVVEASDREPFNHQISIQFDDEDGLARRASIALSSFPDKRLAGVDLEGKAIKSWRADIDLMDGARAFQTVAVVEDPGTSYDYYLFGVSDSDDQPPLDMPSLANTNTFNLWRDRLKQIPQEHSHQPR